MEKESESRRNICVAEGQGSENPPGQPRTNVPSVMNSSKATSSPQDTKSRWYAHVTSWRPSPPPRHGPRMQTREPRTGAPTDSHSPSPLTYPTPVLKEGASSRDNVPVGTRSSRPGWHPWKGLLHYPILKIKNKLGTNLERRERRKRISKLFRKTGREWITSLPEKK